MPGPVWVELHVDDEILAGAQQRWPEVAALVSAVAAGFEVRGAALSLRVREDFARGARDSGLLRRLEQAGHEIGAHAHGRGLAEVLAALRAAGCTPRAATPGLVSARDRTALLRESARLGFVRITDHGPTRAWAYEGLLPRWEEGVVVMAPTVRPTDWGLYGPRGERPALGAAHFARLAGLEAVAHRQGAAAFGFALHEHDLCPPGSLVARQDSLDALFAYVDGRVVRSMDVALPPASPPPQPPRPMQARALRLAKAVGLVAERARPSPLRGAFKLPVGGRQIAVERHAPPEPLGVVVLSHAGPRGGRRVGLSPFGAATGDLLGAGFALYSYDRAGTGGSAAAGPLSPGNPAHTEDWRAVLRLAREEGLPVIAVSYSAGVLPVLAAAKLGDRPDALIDGEAPADRFSLVSRPGDDLAERDLWDDRAWLGLEPVALLPELCGPYARLQAVNDHMHGPMHEHARRLVAAAQAAGLPTRYEGARMGHLHGHPGDLIDALSWAIDRLYRA